MGWNLLATASIVEMLQCAASGVALATSIWQLRDSILDSSAQEYAVDRRKTRSILAEDRQMSELARVLIAAIFLGIGLFSIVLPPPSGELHASMDELLQPIVTRIGLMMATLVLMGDGVRTRRSRIKYNSTVIAERLSVEDTLAGKEIAAIKLATQAASVASAAAGKMIETDKKLDAIQNTATEIKQDVQTISTAVVDTKSNGHNGK